MIVIPIFYLITTKIFKKFLVYICVLIVEDNCSGQSHVFKSLASFTVALNTVQKISANIYAHVYVYVLQLQEHCFTMYIYIY